MTIVKEASTFTARARFFGAANTPQTPSTVRYRIVDLTNDRVVRDWTTLTPAATIEFQIVASDNEIHSDSSSKARRVRTEERVITVQANFETDDQYSDDFPYSIRNLRGFDS